MTSPRAEQPPAYDPDLAEEGERTPGWRVGTLRGTPVYLGRTWPVLVLVVLMTFGPDLMATDPSLGAVAYVVALAYALLLLLSVLAHEAAHALTAQAFGHRVHRIVADLMGGHTAYQSLTNTPGRSALVAVAGPAANALLALVGWWVYPHVDGIPGHLTWAFFASNLFVAVFNLLPGLPLDGGFVLDALVWRLTGSRTKGLLVAGWCGRVLVLVVAWWLIVQPLLGGGRPDLFSIMWGFLIASFLWVGASSAIRSARARALVDRVALGPLAHRALLLPDGASVADAVRAYQEHGPAAIAVTHAGRPVAVVDPRAVHQVPLDRQALTPVLAVSATQPDGWVMDVRPDQPVTPVLERMAHLECGVVLGRMPDGTAVMLDAAEIEAAASSAG